MNQQLTDLLASKLVMVTGKGGTGKTTMAASLAVLGAHLGYNTVLCEIDNQRTSMKPIFGLEPGFQPQQAQENLCVCNIDFGNSLESFIHKMVPVSKIVQLVLENRVISRFLDFTPGSRELVLMSRLGSMVEDYDLVVVDMPASGHAFSMLDVLRSARGLFRSGPVLTLAKKLSELLESEDTKLAFIVLPEDMVVNETIETVTKMRNSGLIGGDPVVFLNRATMPSLSKEEIELIERLSSCDLEPIQREFVRAGVWEARLERATETAILRLTKEFGEAPVLVPPTLGVLEPRATVKELTVKLGRQVGLMRGDLAWS